MSDHNTEKKPHPVTRFVGDMLSTDKKIGDLNGKWAVMLKITVLAGTVVAPLILAWAVWVTSSIFATTHHIDDTINFRERIVDMEKELRITPEKIDHNKKTLEQVSNELKAVNENNARDHQTIMVELGKITTKLERVETNVK